MPSKIAVSEGSGKNVATYAITEDAVTKELGRNVIVDSAGAELKGQKAMTASVPVVLASDQASVPVTVSGVATAAKQDTGNTSLSSIDGKLPAQGQALAAASVPVVLTAAQVTTLTPPAAITGFATSAKQDTGNTSLGNIDTSTAAVNTVIGAKTDAKNTATDTTSVSAIGVLKQISASVQAPPSQAVTNAGTFAVQATLQASSGVDIGKLTANQSVNVAQINGTTPLMGAGASGTGSARVTQANDGGKTLVSTGGSAASSGNNTLVTAGTNKLKVYAFSLSTTSTTAVTCIFQSGASGTELWRVILQAVSGSSTGANLVVPVPAYLFATASATLLNLNLSSAQTVHWSVSYYDEA